MLPSPSLSYEPFKQRRRAFTLAEILIAVSILGVIATFTIPKLLTSWQDNRKIAILKEDFASVSSIWQEGSRSGDLTASTCISYVMDRLNAVSITSYAPIANFGDSATATMPNGSQITIQFGGAQDVIMDWNGSQGNNTLGDDVIDALGMESGNPADGWKYQACGLRLQTLRAPQPGCPYWDSTTTLNNYNLFLKVLQ